MLLALYIHTQIKIHTYHAVTRYKLIMRLIVICKTVPLKKQVLLKILMENAKITLKFHTVFSCLLPVYHRRVQSYIYSVVTAQSINVYVQHV